LDFIDDYMGNVAANAAMLAELDEAKEAWGKVEYLLTTDILKNNRTMHVGYKK
jgi:hypothetical protein